MYNEKSSYYHEYLMHHGIKGMKWGVRRFQNKDGSYTAAGKKRRSTGVYKKAMRNLGGSQFAKNAVENSKRLDDNAKKKALREHAYLADERKKVSKEARAIGRQFEETEYKKLRKEYGIEEKSSKAYDYGRKHKLDLDDGSGGSKEAGEKYMSMWDEIYTLDKLAKSTAKKRADQFVQEIAEIEEDERFAKQGYSDRLMHHGIKGMKWGVRRFQNKDGSYTAAGKKRRNRDEGSTDKSERDRMSFSQRRAAKKELKTQYKKTQRQADVDYESAVSKIQSDHKSKVASAKDVYNTETAPAAKKRDAALAENQRRYDALQKQTESYYKNEIDRNMRKAERYDADADFWGRDSRFGKESAAKADKYLDDASKAEQRRNDARSKNITDHETRTIEIKTDFDNETRDAADRYAAALNKASSERSAKMAKAGEEYTKSMSNAKLSYKQAKKELRRR